MASTGIILKQEACFLSLRCLETVLCAAVRCFRKPLIGTWGAGLLRIDAANLGDENPAFEQFLHDKSSSSILDDIIYAINQDAEGNILVGSRSGLSVLRDGIFYNYFPDDRPESLPYNEVNSILCTRDNSLWLGMFGGGVCKVNSRSSAIERMELPSVRGKYKTNSVKSIYRIDSTEYLFGIAGHGFIKYNRAQDSFVNYQEIPSFKGLLYTSVVEDIMRREDSGEICFASYDRGLWLYDPAGNTTKVFNSANSSLSTDCIRALEQDKEGNVFLGTRYEPLSWTKRIRFSASVRGSTSREFQLRIR